LAWFSF